MTNSSLHALGLAIAAIAHAGVGAGIYYMDSEDKEDRKILLAKADNYEIIEASLARLAPEKPKRQPQKKTSPKVAPPEANAISNNAQAEPTPAKKRENVPPQNIDLSATTRKLENIDLSEEPSDVDHDSSEGGSSEGSKWGTEDEARGHPYIGELKGRIVTVWKVPTVETQTGTAIGCVRLDAAGKIVARELDQKSGIATLDRSVSEALRNASDMDEPVPDRLLSLLTRKGICFRFKNEQP